MINHNRDSIGSFQKICRTTATQVRTHRISSAILIAISFVNLSAFANAADQRTEIHSLSNFHQEHCVHCHDSSSREGDLDLENLSLEANDPMTIAKWERVLDRVQAGEMPPADEPKIDTTAVQAYLKSLHDDLQQRSATYQQTEGRARARRINRDEYQNTIRDLLSVHRDLRNLLPEDGRSLGFDKVAGALNVSAEHLEGYIAAAEIAIDEAFEPMPSSNKRKIPQRWEDMGRLQRAFQFQFSRTDDALVYFSDHWDNITGFEAKSAGRYRFTVRAYAYQNDAPVKARFRVGYDKEASRRLLTYSEFPPEGTEVTVDAWLERGETLHICPIGTAPRSNNMTIQRVHLKRGNPGSKYKGPGLAVQWAEVEGPIPDARFQREILGDVNLQAGTRDDARAILGRFLPRAFRRPVKPHETEHYLSVFDTAFADEQDFEQSLRQTLQTVLCSPHFLYLHGRPGPLNDYELATRLSYFLWNSLPDTKLHELAASGSLRDPKSLREQTERMLNDPRAEAFLEGFTAQWLDLRLINATTPDAELYPEFDELLEWSSVQETRRFFAELLGQNLSLMNFVKSDFLILNDRLAEHYGIDGVTGVDFRKVPIAEDSVRGGLLGQASILKVTANGTTSSPILRGFWVMDRLVGKTPPPPPANVPALEPDIRGAKSIREQLAKHREESTCAACHATIDPPGFALECFDVIGGYRERYRASREAASETLVVARPIHLDIRSIERDPKLRVRPKVTVGLGMTVGSNSEYEGKSFRDVREFRELLMSDPKQVTASVVRHLTTYATGTGPQFADRAIVNEITEGLAKQNYGLRSAIHDVVQSPMFLNR